MSINGMTLTVLATGLAEAVRKDEAPEEGGFDLSAGLFGTHVSNWLRSVANDFIEATGCAESADEKERLERAKLDVLVAKYGIPPACQQLVPYASLFAIMAHGHQAYGNGQPYSVHLRAVANIVESYGPVAQMAALLHDVVEDTSLELYEIEGAFGEDVARAVALCTDMPGANRKERKANTNAKLAKADTVADRIGLIVKAADRLANVRQSVVDNSKLLKMYREEHADFRTAAYRPGLCDEIWTELDSLITENRG